MARTTIFFGRPGSEGRGRDEVGTQSHQGDEPSLGIARLPSTRRWQPEGLAVFVSVGDAEGRAVHSVEGETAPTVLVCCGVCPRLGRAIKDSFEWGCAHAVPPLRDGARRYGLAGGGPLVLLARQNEPQVSDDLLDRPVSEQGHADDQPDDYRRRLLAPSDRGRAGLRQGGVDPFGVEHLSESLEAGRDVGIQDVFDGLGQEHGTTLRSVIAAQ